MRGLIAFFVLAFSGMSAWAQSSQVTIRQGIGFLGCPILIINNLSDHVLELDLRITFTGSSASIPNESPRNYSRSDRIGLRIRDSAEASVIGGVVDIDCKKPISVAWDFRVTDHTAIQEAEARRFQQQVKEADRLAALQRQEQADKKELERQKREAEVLARQADKERAMQVSRDTQALQEKNQLDAVRNIIATGDPRCRQLVGPLRNTAEEWRAVHAKCMENIRLADKTAPRYEFGKIDPNTCGEPSVSWYNSQPPEMVKEAEAKLKQLISECQRARSANSSAHAYLPPAPYPIGPDPRVVEAARIQAEQAAALRQRQGEEAARQAAALRAQQQRRFSSPWQT